MIGFLSFDDKLLPFFFLICTKKKINREE